MHMGNVHIHSNNSVKYVNHYIPVGPISITLFHLCIYTQCVCVHTHVCVPSVYVYVSIHARVGACRGQRLISSIFYHCLLIFLRLGLLLNLGLVILPELLVSKSPGTAWSTTVELVLD